MFTHIDRPTEDTVFNLDPIHISQNNDDKIVKYPDEEIAGICRYFLRVYANIVFNDFLVYSNESFIEDNNKEKAEKAKEKREQQKQQKKQKELDRQMFYRDLLMNRIVSHIKLYDTIKDIIRAITSTWSQDYFKSIPYVDVPSPNGIIRFENKGGVIYASMLEESA